MDDYYRDSLEHLHDELLLVDLLIHAQVIKHRALKKSSNELQGLYISEEEIDQLLAGSPNYREWVERYPNINDDYERLSEALKALCMQIQKRQRGALEKGLSLRMVEIAECYNLSTFEMEVLSICLAPEFDSKYRKLFSYLHDDVTRKNPTVELVLNMLCSSFKEKSLVRSSFSLQAPLVKNNLIEFIHNPNDLDRPLITREIKANERFVNYILDDKRVDDELHLFADYYKGKNSLASLVLPGGIRARLSDFISYYCGDSSDKENFIFFLHGADGVGMEELSGAICREIKAPLLVVDLFAMHNSGTYFERAVDLILRESRFSYAAIYLKNCDFLFEERNSYLQRYLIERFDENSLLTFMGSRERLTLYGEFARQKLITIELARPDYEQRKELWSRSLSEHQLDDTVDIKELAGKYNLTAGQVCDVVTTAGVFALWRSPSSPLVTKSLIEEAAHIHSNQRLGQLAQRIIPKHSWEDIILEREIKEQLTRMLKMFRYKHQVYSEWNFDKKLSLGKGISALFYGEPGTGKTLAAEIIAAELAMELYKIDISTVISKYVGETEKNLARIFNEAESSNAILFFDEADAIFGKRTEVQDSHDRYSNIEVSYLLQRIDEYNGIVIMATNFNNNIDDAFERRLHFSINFPAPDEASRLAIWQNIFPKGLPLADDIDLPLLAKELDIAGGNIKNIALQAAFYAADEAEPAERILSMRHLLKAGEDEYKKISRLWRGCRLIYKKD